MCHEYQRVVDTSLLQLNISKTKQVVVNSGRSNMPASPPAGIKIPGCPLGYQNELDQARNSCSSQGQATRVDLFSCGASDPSAPVAPWYVGPSACNCGREESLLRLSNIFHSFQCYHVDHEDHVEPKTQPYHNLTIPCTIHNHSGSSIVFFTIVSSIITYNILCIILFFMLSSMHAEQLYQSSFPVERLIKFKLALAGRSDHFPDVCNSELWQFKTKIACFNFYRAHINISVDISGNLRK